MPKILIVEDNDMNLDMLSRRLQRKGFEIVTARDGQAGVKEALAQSPDLILMDMSLPVLDGWQATKAIKANPKTASIPVIALTAHAMETDRQNAMAAGCDEYHTKPIDLTSLLAQISKLIAR
jgi:two-component system, cell cycle response regulator DivK